ncbi:1-acyl-sn-glycerol-3-phosphate acyltransferase 1, chloroplastic [Carica papaya]|uniref:1-acyl-sn-glycerol-3-phosphate acyltransferase 1, chloroplastic n=1 Tax=Carica papaya TaxID=3649 RepID=UPI000B8CE772|nr:1-acyl-sn-glycerol-3-phosphate acyltransferase 1, chloroplastic [Carica papaya]XP_021899226.1 1-acyl-sn-glycerol-3-phosphate acyltransferase 1, chloroplastic [Carica papaya]XP_021899227.1 1-acyl-sn-glycerol-3-phosphate acyltransferase 1, chloroplastic [Carica papaya]
MEIASPPRISSLTPRYRIPRNSATSSLLPLFAFKGLHFGFSSYEWATLRGSYNAAENSIFWIRRECAGGSWYCHNLKVDINRPLHNKTLPNRNGLSRTIVRSELAGTGIPESVNPLSELKLGSKIRGICFYAITAVAAIFFFVLMLIGHPFVLLFDRYRRKFHHFIAKIWATATVTPFFKIEFEGLENLPPPDTPAVYVSNHQSFLDIYTLLTLGRTFKFISKTGIFLFPIIGWAMFMMGLIPLKRMDSRSQLECLKRCMDLVRKGASVFFFPEGTRSKDGELHPFKKGAFSVAAKTGVPVVPITLMGTGKIMPAGMEGILNPGLVKVVVHKPIEGSNADVLCREARNTIADVLNHQS